MQLKHFENLANLERSIIKQQFVKAASAARGNSVAKAPVPMSYGGKKIKGNTPQVASITALTGDVKIKNPYTTGRKYPKIPPKNRYANRRGKPPPLSLMTG